MPRIADNNYRTKHSEEIGFLNRLCIDLKKFCLGNGPAAKDRQEIIVDGSIIGMERLEEFTRVIAKLEQCKEQIRFK